MSPWRHARAVLLLPFMNTVLIPALILVLTGDYRVAGDAGSLLASAAGLALIGIGATLVVRAIALFVRIGQGTLAPWDPTRVLIAEGLYRYSRNPMKAGLFLVLIGESLLLGSRAIAIWAAAFIVVNVLYIRYFEEPGLKRRFGRAYADYCKRVPRWFGLGKRGLAGSDRGVRA